MQRLMTRYFAKWVKKERLATDTLSRTIEALVNDKHEGDLGQGVFKQRIARVGQGKRGA